MEYVSFIQERDIEREEMTRKIVRCESQILDNSKVISTNEADLNLLNTADAIMTTIFKKYKSAPFKIIQEGITLFRCEHRVYLFFQQEDDEFFISFSYHDVIVEQIGNCEMTMDIDVVKTIIQTTLEDIDISATKTWDGDIQSVIYDKQRIFQLGYLMPTALPRVLVAMPAVTSVNQSKRLLHLAVCL